MFGEAACLWKGQNTCPCVRKISRVLLDVHEDCAFNAMQLMALQYCTHKVRSLCSRGACAAMLPRRVQTFVFQMRLTAFWD